MIPDELRPWRDRLEHALLAEVDKAPSAGVASATERLSRWAPRLAAAAALAAVALVLSPFREAGRGPILLQDASAAAALEKAASARVRDPLLLHPGQFMYLRVRYLTATGVPRQGILEQWIAPDGHGRVLDRRGSNHPARQALTQGRRAPFWVAGSRLSYADLRRLGQSPHLARMVIQHGSRSLFPARDRGRFSLAQRKAYAAYSGLRDLLYTPAPLAARQQFYRAVAQYPARRVRQDGDMATVEARAGAVEFSMTLNLATGQLVSIERRLRERSWQIPGPPRLLSRAVVLSQGIVEEPTLRPTDATPGS